MPDAHFADLLSQFTQSLIDCRSLYRSSGELAAAELAGQLSHSREKFVELMDDLHGALLVKVFITVGQCDRAWSRNEQEMACALIEHLWRRRLEGHRLREAILEMAEKSLALNWYALVRPFDELAPLRNRVSELETLVVRITNLIARADGAIQPVEAAIIRTIQEEIRRHLRPIPIDEPTEHAAADQAVKTAAAEVEHTAGALPARSRRSDQPKSSKKDGALAAQANDVPKPKDSSELLAEALAELDSLIGLEGVKQEVRTLANFLKVQHQRAEAGLPATSLTLHMVFGGNPGTGKTSVARIIGRIFSAMGVLERGHLVETDRSSLVAEYAGQTGPKANKKIDEALGGVLFIDEAYTLVSDEGNDPYGAEAVQTLLKRMEDERDRLVVILAGYPAEMEGLLQSNPGLSSRFARHLEFADYAPVELARIFSLMCEKNHYRLLPSTRAKLMLGLTWLYQRRDRYFGNGRMVRNLFEHALRRQANRIASISRLSIEELSTLESDDVEFSHCPSQLFQALAGGEVRLMITCPHCTYAKNMPHEFLGQTLRCPKCRKEFAADWGPLV